MTYTLVAYFLLTGGVYVERDALNLQACAGQAAIIRQQFLGSLPKLNRRIGEVRYLCIPERSIARRATDQHGIGRDN